VYPLPARAANRRDCPPAGPLAACGRRPQAGRVDGGPPGSAAAVVL